MTPAAVELLRVRCSGVLLHPTSLPGEGIGEIGGPARAWADWLAEAGQGLWQLLPLGPTSRGGSPYDGLSAFAGNPWLIDLSALAAEGLLAPEDVRGKQLPADRVEFARVGPWKERLLRRAFGVFRRHGDRAAWEAYRSEHSDWLEDYALFRALRDHFGEVAWTQWEPGARRRDPAALRRWGERLRDQVDLRIWEQWTFDRQWEALRAYAHSRGVHLVGDLPIFVSHDSADVWSHPELFRLDRDGRPEVVAGVPPDYFSAAGQRWGNPLYRWEEMERQGFRWWTRRFRRTLERTDVVRVDHFRGFAAAWEIPADAPTAAGGRWSPGPGRALFDAVREQLGELPLIAEDLGLITPEVDALRDALGLPGMRVLQFAWDGASTNPHLPENHPPRAVAYTGTHDNDTLLGWLGSGATPEERARLQAALPAEEGGLPWAAIRLVLGSPARWAILPAQDVLGLGSEARMNVPGVAENNWAWRLPGGIPSPELAHRLRRAAQEAGRAPR